MKTLPKTLLVLSAAWSFASCSNLPKCKLPPGVPAFPKCQANPPKHTWPGTDGRTPLPYSVALPPGRPKAIVLIFPGMDTVTGDYSSLTSDLVRHGYGVYGSENRSFIYGPAQEQGNPHDWHPWVEDVKAFSKFVTAKHPGLPVFWHGQSFGAVEVLQATAEAKGPGAPAGIIVHSPAYAMMPPRKSFFRSLEYGSIAWVRFPQLATMDKNGFTLTTDNKWNCRWMWSDDRLRKGYKVRFVIQAANMGIHARKNSHDLTLPVLGMWGGKDRLTLNNDESQRPAYDAYLRCELAGGRAEQFYRKEGGHLLTEGDTKEAALHAITRWLDARTR